MVCFEIILGYQTSDLFLWFQSTVNCLSLYSVTVSKQHSLPAVVLHVVHRDEGTDILPCRAHSPGGVWSQQKNQLRPERCSLLSFVAQYSLMKGKRGKSMHSPYPPTYTNFQTGEEMVYPSTKIALYVHPNLEQWGNHKLVRCLGLTSGDRTFLPHLNWYKFTENALGLKIRKFSLFITYVIFGGLKCFGK